MIIAPSPMSMNPLKATAATPNIKYKIMDGIHIALSPMNQLKAALKHSHIFLCRYDG